MLEIMTCFVLSIYGTRTDNFVVTVALQTIILLLHANNFPPFFTHSPLFHDQCCKLILVTVSAPKIQEHPLSTDVGLFELVNFSCVVKGYNVIVTWHTPLTELLEFENVRTETISSKNLLTSVLTITRTIGHYDGIYYCKATNEAKEVKSESANLNVQGSKYKKM